MTPVIRMVAGSHLYGTDTAASDTDLKSVFLPSARDILLQSCQDVVVTQREKLHGERNQAGDVDETGFALHRFLDFLGQGQIVALDMVFTPPEFWLGVVHPVWHRIVESRLSLIGLSAASFLGYCRAHAERNGARGARLAELTQMARFIREERVSHGGVGRLEDIEARLRGFIASSNFVHTKIVLIDQPGPDGGVAHLSCAGRKTPFRTKLGDVEALLAHAAASYGARAKASSKGSDGKALSHALRVGYQTQELLSTGHITFPRPEAAHLRAIKCGELNDDSVKEEIDLLMQKIEALASSSKIVGAEHDKALRDEIIMD
ncbi:DNA polymerase beta superfamily protein [Asaia sp. HN010]|uniref:DNA polymerase beta superfamily protein n=1 Tax=Asaia sp. HN010 TaxID=3081233 RepID=UPI0030199DF6